MKRYIVSPVSFCLQLLCIPTLSRIYYTRFYWTFQGFIFFVLCDYSVAGITADALPRFFFQISENILRNVTKEPSDNWYTLSTLLSILWTSSPFSFGFSVKFFVLVLSIPNRSQHCASAIVVFHVPLSSKTAIDFPLGIRNCSHRNLRMSFRQNLRHPMSENLAVHKGSLRFSSWTAANFAQKSVRISYENNF